MVGTVERSTDQDKLNMQSFKTGNCNILVNLNHFALCKFTKPVYGSPDSLQAIHQSFLYEQVKLHRKSAPEYPGTQNCVSRDRQILQVRQKESDAVLVPLVGQ